MECPCSRPCVRFPSRPAVILASYIMRPTTGELRNTQTAEGPILPPSPHLFSSILLVQITPCHFRFVLRFSAPTPPPPPPPAHTQSLNAMRIEGGIQRIECGQCKMLRPTTASHCYEVGSSHQWANPTLIKPPPMSCSMTYLRQAPHLSPLLTNPPTHQPTDPPRPQCKLCIEGLDHHCPWTGKCIGKRTIFYFHAFLVLLVSQIGSNAVALFRYRHSSLLPPHLPRIHRTPCTPFDSLLTALRPIPPLTYTPQCIHICLVLVGTLYFVTSR